MLCTAASTAGLAAQIWDKTSRLVGCPKLIGLRTCCPRVFVIAFCLTAQGLDGDPAYLLDEFLCYRFKLFRRGAAFSWCWSGACFLKPAARAAAAVGNSERQP